MEAEESMCEFPLCAKQQQRQVPSADLINIKLPQHSFGLDSGDGTTGIHNGNAKIRLHRNATEFSFSSKRPAT